MVEIYEGVAILLISLIPILIGIWVVTEEIVRKGKKDLIYLLSIIVSISLSYISGIIVHYTLSPIWKSINMIFYIPISIFSILFLDLLHYKTIEPWKLGITLFLSGLLFYYHLKPNQSYLFQYTNGEWFLATSSVIVTLNMILLGWSFCIFLYYSFLLIVKSPPILKKYGAIFLIAVIFIVMGPIFPYIFPGENTLPHIDTIPTSIGFFIFVFVFSKHPELFYVLPFKVYRMTALDANSGLSLYDYSWESDQNRIMKEGIYSGILQGMRIMITESLKQGEVSEIKTKNSVILFEYDSNTNLVFILVSSKSSTSLYHSLHRFKQRFILQNSEYLNKRTQVSLFRQSDKIVHEIFPFFTRN